MKRKRLATFEGDLARLRVDVATLSVEDLQSLGEFYCYYSVMAVDVGELDTCRKFEVLLDVVNRELARRGSGVSFSVKE